MTKASYSTAHMRKYVAGKSTRADVMIYILFCWKTARHLYRASHPIAPIKGQLGVS